MIIYRAVKEEQYILSGKGPSYNGSPGRWNSMYQQVLYCGDSPLVSFSEKGYHSLFEKFDLEFDLDIEKIDSGRATKKTYESLSPETFYLGEIEIPEETRLFDVENSQALEEILIKMNIGNVEISNYRTSSFLSLPQRWTQKLGKYIEQEGFEGIIAKSARTEAGNVVSLFKGGMKKAKLKKSHEFILGYLDKDHDPHQHKKPVSRDHLYYECPVNGYGILEILRL